MLYGVSQTHYQGWDNINQAAGPVLGTFFVHQRECVRPGYLPRSTRLYNLRNVSTPAICPVHRVLQGGVHLTQKCKSDIIRNPEPWHRAVEVASRAAPRLGVEAWRRAFELPLNLGECSVSVEPSSSRRGISIEPSRPQHRGVEASSVPLHRAGVEAFAWWCTLGSW